MYCLFPAKTQASIEYFTCVGMQMQEVFTLN